MIAMMIFTASVVGGTGGFALTYLVQDYDAEGGGAGDSGVSAMLVPTIDAEGRVGLTVAGSF